MWRLEIAGKNVSATSHSPRKSLALGKQVMLMKNIHGKQVILYNILILIQKNIYGKQVILYNILKSPFYSTSIKHIEEKIHIIIFLV